MSTENQPRQRRHKQTAQPIRAGFQTMFIPAQKLVFPADPARLWRTPLVLRSPGPNQGPGVTPDIPQVPRVLFSTTSHKAAQGEAAMEPAPCPRAEPGRGRVSPSLTRAGDRGRAEWERASRRGIKPYNWTSSGALSLWAGPHPQIQLNRNYPVLTHLFHLVPIVPIRGLPCASSRPVNRPIPAVTASTHWRQNSGRPFASGIAPSATAWWS